MSSVLRQWAFSGVVLALLNSCAGAATAPASLTTTALLKPGDRIGDMMLTNQEPASGSEDFQCTMPADSHTPATATIQCADVPRGKALNLSHGWGSATQQELENAMASMQWQEFIDGQELDLASFQAKDAQEGGTWGRAWKIWLVNLTPGKHSVRRVYHVTRAIKDSMDEKAVGDYELNHEFTVK